MCWYHKRYHDESCGSMGEKTAQEREAVEKITPKSHFQKKNSPWIKSLSRFSLQVCTSTNQITKIWNSPWGLWFGYIHETPAPGSADRYLARGAGGKMKQYYHFVAVLGNELDTLPPTVPSWFLLWQDSKTLREGGYVFLGNFRVFRRKLWIIYGC